MKQRQVDLCEFKATLSEEKRREEKRREEKRREEKEEEKRREQILEWKPPKIQAEHLLISELKEKVAKKGVFCALICAIWIALNEDAILFLKFNEFCLCCPHTLGCGDCDGA